MKRSFIVVGIVLTIYSIVSIATSKSNNYLDYANLGCVYQTPIFKKKGDTLGNIVFFNGFSESNGGNLVYYFFRIQDTNKKYIAGDFICKFLKDSCKVYNSRILIYDTFQKTNFDTLFNMPGKRVLTYYCR